MLIGRHALKLDVFFTHMWAEIETWSLRDMLLKAGVESIFLNHSHKRLSEIYWRESDGSWGIFALLQMVWYVRSGKSWLSEFMTMPWSMNFGKLSMLNRRNLQPGIHNMSMNRSITNEGLRWICDLKLSPVVNGWLVDVSLGTRHVFRGQSLEVKDPIWYGLVKRLITSLQAIKSRGGSWNAPWLSKILLY